jgi:hypothetical protein
MAVDQDGEGSLIALVLEALEQVSVTEIASGVDGADFTQIDEQVAEGCFRHVPVPLEARLPL